MRRMLGFAMPIFAAAALMSACGTTESPSETPAASSGPVTVTDSRGKAVTLPAAGRKVVALEWGEAEMLVTLGVMPVGVADTKGYGTWVTAAKLDASVKDVGTRGEPSVDSIVALQPDLVVMEAERDSPLIGQLEKFVPVIVTKGSDASRNLERMREDFNMIATAVGKTQEARRALADFDQAIADAKAKIAAAGHAGKGFAVADGWKEGSTISIRMFGQGALVSQTAIALGLKNAWNGDVDAAWGLGTTDVEGLSPLKDSDIRFFYNASDGDDVFANGLAGNQIWDSLAFVKNKQLYKMPNGIWTFGGPLSCRQHIDAIVKAFTA
ncbi:ABC transporter substrate-binding protein [Rhizocola hellebori]|uniref:ABC transporter substrate-binding protein n=1 Tax=Rhizocola hellebori TaxID=1392758 RepID=A0A8J3Q4S1_9ACTN|nr:iron-siderophore ABC transporter substrate-binding protein [Rhizocola hellebori]GIH03366.1 ABC transporter substrate-binding protein [Rhizocola hellebori]